jgi:hypothetical protein
MDAVIGKITALAVSEKGLTPAAISERMATLSGDAHEINQLNIRMRGHLQIIQQSLSRAYEDIHNLASKAMRAGTAVKHNVTQLTESEVKKNVGVFGIEGGGLFEVRVRFSPFALASLDRADGHVGVGFVRQVTLRDLKLGESALVITIAVVVRITERETSFWKVGLQSQRFIRT